MPRSPTPWIGLVALVAMFVLPLLPERWFEGRRTIKHRPRRHICGDCGAPWTDGHACAPESSVTGSPPLRAQLQRRTGPRADTGTAIVGPKAR